jgi:hypothetical protein
METNWFIAPLEQAKLAFRICVSSVILLRPALFFVSFTRLGLLAWMGENNPFDTWLSSNAPI